MVAFFLFRFKLQDRRRSLFTAIIGAVVFFGIAGALVRPEIFLGGPLFLFMAGLPLFTLPAIIVLLYALIRRRYQFGWIRKLLLTVSICLLPTGNLTMACFAFIPEWRGQKWPGWQSLLLDGWAGTTLLPFWILASIALGLSIWKESFRRRSICTFTMGVTNLVIAVVYVCACLLMGFTSQRGASDEWRTILLLAAYPACAAILLWLYLWVMKRTAVFGELPWWFALAWFWGLLGAWLLKIPLARSLFESLPKEPPQNDCFIVSAAALGHRQLVGSRRDAATGQLKNPQLRRFRRFETRLRQNRPQTHRRLRLVYNRWAPSIAARIGCRFTADLMYLLLKPLELLAAAWLRCRGGRTGRQ